jgi:hypothetical protein
MTSVGVELITLMISEVPLVCQLRVEESNTEVRYLTV